MTCEEFHARVPALALGAVSEEEEEALEAHLTAPGAHARCAEAYAEANDAAALLSLSLPPVKLRDPRAAVNVLIDAAEAAAPGAPARMAPVRLSSREGGRRSVPRRAGSRRRVIVRAVQVASLALAAALGALAVYLAMRSGDTVRRTTGVGPGDRAATLAPATGRTVAASAPPDVSGAAGWLLLEPGVRRIDLTPEPGTHAVGALYLGADGGLLLVRGVEPGSGESVWSWVTGTSGSPEPAAKLVENDALLWSVVLPKHLAALPGGTDLLVSLEPDAPTTRAKPTRLLLRAHVSPE
jgi:hypothetical protein